MEFALFAPVLFFGLLATVDLGFALFERMTIDHVLRAGAQSAMSDQTKSDVLNVLESTAEKNFVLAGSTTDPAAETLSVSVNRYSACPQDPERAVEISTICPGPQPTSIFYRLSAQKRYQGMILPAIAFHRSLRIQIR